MCCSEWLFVDIFIMYNMGVKGVLNRNKALWAGAEVLFIFKYIHIFCVSSYVCGFTSAVTRGYLAYPGSEFLFFFLNHIYMNTL